MEIRPPFANWRFCQTNAIDWKDSYDNNLSSVFIKSKIQTKF